jgi:hypothetical protein
MVHWPTPTKADAAVKTGMRPSRAATNRKTGYLNETITGQLNPMWVEWLMGWPLGWTDLKPLETDRFRQWLEKHGTSCAKEPPKGTASTDSQHPQVAIETATMLIRWV